MSHADSPFCDVLPDTHEEWCRCGRKMEFKIRENGIDRATGKMRYERVLLCPRFERQWRNLWMGGITHDGHSLDYPMLDLCWR